MTRDINRSGIRERRVGFLAVMGLVVCGLALTLAAPTAAAQTTSPRAEHLLYSQLDDDQGVGIVSEIFFGYNRKYRSLAADDFTVPAGATWSIDGVDAVGRYHVSGG